MFKFIKKIKLIHWWFLAFIVIYHTILLYFHSTSSLTPDEPTHFLISMLYREVILNLPKIGFNLNNIFSFGVNYLLLYPKMQITYPPLFHLITGLVSYSILGVTPFAGRFTSSLFSFGALVFLFLSVRKLFNDKIAFLTCVLFAFSPYLIVYSGSFMMDTTAYFFVFLSLFIFLIALEKKDYKWFALLGITSFFATMSKRPAILFSIFVVVYSLIKKVDIKRILVFILVFALLLSPYGFLMYKIGGIDITLHVVQTYGSEQGEPGLFSLYNWIYYFNGYFPILIELILLATFAYYIYKKEKNWKILLLFSLIFYIGLSIPQNKECRFAQYIFTPMFVIFSYYLIKLKEKLKKNAEYYSLILIFFVGYLLLSISVPQTTSFLQNKPIKETSEYIYSNLPEGANIGMISENGRFSSAAIMVYISQLDQEKEVQFFRSCIFNEMSSEEILNFSKENNIYYMVSTKPQIPEFEKNIQKLLDSNGFELEKTIDEAKIYRQKNYTHKNIQIRKNYICILNKWIYENTTLKDFKP